MATLIQSLQNVLAGRDPLLPVETRRIVLKDVLQAYVLDYLYNHPTYRGLIFYGDTCLQVVYGINRLSDGLTFDNRSGLELGQFGPDLAAYFQKSLGYSEATAKTQEDQSGRLRVALKLPLLYVLDLASTRDEALHLRVEISHQPQVAVIQRTPVLVYGRSLVAAHFSIETMMAGKMLACLERGTNGVQRASSIQGRDYYDLLWFMQQHIQPLEEKLAQDGDRPYTPASAMQALQEKIALIKPKDLAVDLLPMFESRAFIEAWLEAFHETFNRLAGGYIDG
jgi:hypothetical protein